MYLYRIAKTKYIRDLLGEGARRAGGRWNKQNTAVLYTADSTALATLESLVHSPLHIIPKHRSILTLDLPDNLGVEKIEAEQLPERWWDYPAPKELAKLGERWLKAKKTLALSVPSAVTPQGEGCNILLNPSHPDFSEIEIASVSDFSYDLRLFS